MNTPVYLDYNATTPVDPDVLETMLPYFREHFGNASSKGHAFGWVANEAVEIAREKVAGCIGATPNEIVFTAGATESINLAIKGVTTTYARKGNHIITAATEHSAVLESVKALEQLGLVKATILPVGRDGLVDPERLEEAVTDETILVTIMWANNETGVLQDIPALAAMTRAHGALFMTDATQAVGKVPVNVESVDFLALSGHKFYAPKGVGALFARRRTRLFSLLHGGGQERGLRGGTLNVPGIVGIGRAAEIAAGRLDEDAIRLASLRDEFESRLTESSVEAVVNTGSAPRLPQTSNLCFKGRRSADIIKGLRDVAMSAGSACSSGSAKPSHVLTAMGLDADDAFASIRFSLGRFTTREEVHFAANKLVDLFDQVPA